jgi:hypothetical protein
MPHPTLIIPFALAPTEHARDLLATLQRVGVAPQRIEMEQP